jgi:hypothetical protein
MSEKKTGKKRRFYFGAAKNTLSIDGKRVKSHQSCLVDLKDRRIAWFTFPSELADAISMLVTKFEPEVDNFFIRETFSKYVASKGVVEEEFEILLHGEEVLASEGIDEKTSVLDFFGKLMVLREEYVGRLSAIREERPERGMDELNDGFTDNEVVFFPESEEYSDERLHEPLFSIDDFTDNLDEVPEEILKMWEFYDQRTIAHSDARQIMSIREEVESVFDPRSADEKRKSSGLRGVPDTGCRDADSCLYD